MPRTKCPTRPPRAEAVQVHILVTPEQRRRAKMVAAHADTRVSDLFREIFLREVDRRYEALGLDAGNPRKARPV